MAASSSSSTSKGEEVPGFRGEDTGEGGAVAYGANLDHLAENKELMSLVMALPAVYKEMRNRELSEERFTLILDKYQELPHLLDPYLEPLINQLFLLIQPDMHPGIRKQAFRYLYLVSKVRGPKVMVRWFPHEVKDFEPVLVLLQEQDPRDFETWETRYILLLWLSFLLMIPFDLSRMDGVASTNAGSSHTIVQRVFDIARLYVRVNDKCRDAAALLLAKLVTRQDVKSVKLEEYIGWAFDRIAEAEDSTAQAGIMASLGFLFKHGKRDDMAPLAPHILIRLKETFEPSTNTTQLRKLHAKVVQQLGMAFLPPRLAKWRYQRGARSLEEALTAPPPAPPSAPVGAAEGEEEEEEDYEVPPEVEDVIELLLGSLQDPDTVVRWTAAKGVGKVTGRLPKDLADEVLQSLLQLFGSREFDGAWHGGCLALAELGRRGLLLPHRLPQVVPVVLKALAYDERRGACTVGAHVRDAACYVIWSFARAYQPDDLAPYVKDIASALVVAMMYDREVNCRRAASAAFQENVGRQGTFPHGIHILTTADYFALGSISNAYLTISVQVAEFEEYTRPLIQHLYQLKLLHWDSVIRDLAGKALRNLTSLDQDYMKDTVLPALLPLVTDSDPCLRHGALHAVSEICDGLGSLAHADGIPFTQYVGDTTTQALLQVASKLREASVFKGHIGEIMRPAALKFIEVMCGCGLPVLLGDPVLTTWQSLVEDNLPHTESTIRESAVSAFSCLCVQYYSADPQTIATVQGKFIPAYTSQLVNASQFVRMGYALALGGLPRALLADQLWAVLDPLVQSCKVTEVKFVEARRDAVIAITRICSTVCTSGTPDQDGGVAGGVAHDLRLSADDVECVFECLVGCLGDYTMDSRGDIGAVVREAAMDGLKKLLAMITLYDSSLLQPGMVSEAVCGLVQQSNEKIDRTRAVACQALDDVVFHEPAIPHIPSHAFLRELLEEAHSSPDTNWLVARTTFPLTVQLLSDPCYRYRALLGLVVSVGGFTESTVRQSSAALMAFLKPPYQPSKCADVSSLDPFADTLLAILRQYPQDMRVILPLLKSLDLLLGSGVFDLYATLPEHPFPATLLELLNKEVKGCKDPVKLLASINVFCGMLMFPAIRTSTLNRIMLLLCHAFPKVRKSMADQFYVTLLSFEEIIDPAILDQVMSILSETAWDGVLVSVREQRNRLCQLLDLPVPKLLGKSSVKKGKGQDDLSSYKDLVDRAGY